MMRKGTKVKIFGQEYSIKGDGDEKYITELASYVDDRMRDISANNKSIDTTKVGILAAINIAHELFKLKKEHGEKEMALYKKTGDIIDFIDEQFEDIRL